jgi:DNA-binding IscR family transcriptional regulator
VSRVLLDADGVAVPFETLRDATGLPAHQLEDTLARMTDANIAKRVGRAGYALARAADEVTIEDLYAATAELVGAMRPEEWADVSEDFARVANQLREGLRRPLSSLCETEAAPRPVKKAKRGKGRSGTSSR